jgi:hypothetical protein
MGAITFSYMFTIVYGLVLTDIATTIDYLFVNQHTMGVHIIIIVWS